MLKSFFVKFFIGFVLKKFNHLRDVHRFAFKRYANEIALICPSGSFTYAEIQLRCQSLISALEESGLNKSDHLFVLLPDEHEQYEVRVACTDMGLIPSAFHSAYSLQQLLDAADRVKPRLFIYDDLLGRTIAEHLKKHHPNMMFLEIGKNKSYEQAILSRQPKYSTNSLDENDPVALGFTSGTTGKPKALTTTSRTNLASLRLLIKNLRISTSDRNIMLLGIPLIGAGSGVFLPTMLSGGTLIIPEKYDIELMLPLIEEYKVTRSFMTPSLVIDLLDSSRRINTNLQSLKTIIYGSAPMPAAKLEECINEMGAIFQQGYGMAEVLPPVSLLQMHQHVDENNHPVSKDILSSVGKVIDGVSVRIVDNNDVDCAVNEIGEVIIHSPTIFDGYWEQPELSSMTIKNCYMYSSDFGFIDDLGYLHILDRRADVFEHDGQTIYPRQIEEVVHTFAAIKEAAIVEVNKQFILCASLRKAYRQQHKTELSEQLMSLLKTKVKPYQVPEKIFLIDELPRSILGKVLRKEIREWITQNKLVTGSGS